MTIVRLSKSSVGINEQAALARVVAAGYLGMGEEVRLFEGEVAAFLGGGLEVVAVATGTAALHLAVAGLDIGPGDEVLVPTLTYVASFQAIAATGAIPVACDVRDDTLAIDLADAARRVGPRTRAIMPVHYASHPGERAAIFAFAAARGLRVIEDAAHSFGGRDVTGARIGADGDIVCFSFDGIKNITCGEGGALVTRDPALAQRARDARLLGVEKDTEKRFSGQRSWDFDVVRQGFRYHMSNLMAAVGRVQLTRLEGFAGRRRALAERYRAAFAGSNAVRILPLDYDRMVPHIFVVRVAPDRRDGLMAHLRARDIECGLHYKPNHLLTLFADGEARPVAETVYAEMLSLPLHAELGDAEQERVIAAVVTFCETAAL